MVFVLAKTVKSNIKLLLRSYIKGISSEISFLCKAKQPLQINIVMVVELPPD